MLSFLGSLSVLPRRCWAKLVSVAIGQGLVHATFTPAIEMYPATIEAAGTTSPTPAATTRRSIQVFGTYTASLGANGYWQALHDRTVSIARRIHAIVD